MSVAQKEHLTESKSSKGMKDVDDVIAKAIKKIGARKENELCKYLPMHSGGYMHHFTLRKMKSKQPHELSLIIERFVINSDKASFKAAIKYDQIELVNTDKGRELIKRLTAIQ